MKIIRYAMIPSHNLITLVDDVEKYIKMGWQPYGTPFVTPNGNVCQAMVKYDKTDNLVDS